MLTSRTEAQAQPRELWTILDFCKAHGISKTRVYDLLASGELEAVKAGRRSLITGESQRRWLASLPRFVPARAA